MATVTMWDRYKAGRKRAAVIATGFTIVCVIVALSLFGA
jgi:CHASE3 domain sensor protein